MLLLARKIENIRRYFLVLVSGTDTADDAIGINNAEIRGSRRRGCAETPDLPSDLSAQTRDKFV